MLTEQPIDRGVLEEVLRDPSCGAVASFEGRVRGREEDRQVAFIEYEAYRPMAERVLEEIVRKARCRFHLGPVVLIHRLGAVPAGETAILIAAAAPRRSEAFAGCRFLLEQVKLRAPIFKREVDPDGKARWKEESHARPSA